MRTWIIPIACLLLGGCSLPTSGDPGAVPLTWMGDFKGGPSGPGHLTLLFDEVGPTVSGTMYFESTEADGAMPRVTYRIEGTQEDGAIHFQQQEILQADPLTGGRVWCLGSYDLSLGEGDPSPVAMGETPKAPAQPAGAASPAASQGLSGAYSGGAGCAGTTTLQPADTL